MHFPLKVMRQGLSYYYRVNFKRYNWIAVFNVLYFALSLALMMIWLINEVDTSEIHSMSKWNKYTPSQKMLWLLFITWYNLPIYFYIILNIRNVNFKIYVYELLKGRNLYNVIGKASVFIKLSWWYRKLDESFISQSGTSNDSNMYESIASLYERHPSLLNVEESSSSGLTNSNAHNN